MDSQVEVEEWPVSPFTDWPNYLVAKEDQEMFDKEVEVWIKQGILVLWDKVEHGNVKTFLPLMSV